MTGVKNILVLLLVLLTACVPQQYPEQGGAIETCLPTGQDVQGPYRTQDMPFRNVLTPPDEEGQRLIINGTVLSSDCQSLNNALFVVWQTGGDGRYNNTWYRARFLTDENGYFAFETVIPGRYPLGTSFRPAHIHFKVSAPGHTQLTTQLYFSNDPYLAPNDPCSSCRSGDSTHIIDIQQTDNVWRGTFDIVLKR